MPEKRGQGRQMYDVIALHCTHKHTCAHSPCSGLAAASSPGRTGSPAAPCPAKGIWPQRGLVPAQLPVEAAAGVAPFSLWKITTCESSSASSKRQFSKDAGYSGTKIQWCCRDVPPPTREPGSPRSPRLPLRPPPCSGLGVVGLFFGGEGLNSLQQPGRSHRDAASRRTRGRGSPPSRVPPQTPITAGRPGFSPGAAAVLHPPPS